MMDTVSGRISGSLIVAVILAGLAQTTASVQTPRPSAPADWPQWRGPARDGTIASLPAEWPKELTKRWEVSVGAGHSSPVVAGTRVVIIARQGTREIVRALDLASGKQLWQADYDAPYTVNPAAASHGPGPKSTPAIAGGRVFTLGIGGVLSAFDLASGTLRWRTPAPSALPQYGTGTSPVVEGNLVIAHVGGHNDGAITAFDAASGTPRWRWTGDGPAYGSPIIAAIAGVRQVIAVTQKSFVGLNAADGTLLWQLPFTTEYNQSAVTAVARGDQVVFSGLNKPTVALRIRGKGSQWAAEQVWSNDQVPMFMSSPVLIGDTLFGLTHMNRGQLFALNWATGKVLWTTQGREGENASIAGNQAWLVVATTDGELIVGRPAATGFTAVQRYKIADSAVWAHPAYAGRSLVIKDADKVICWGF